MKKRTILFILLIVIPVIFVVGMIALKVYFVLWNDLSLRINPQQKTIDSFRNDVVKVNFTVEKQLNVLCRTECNYAIYDSLTNTTIDSGKFNIFNSKNIPFSIRTPSFQRGQLVYYLDVQCKNIQSYVCQTDGFAVFTNAVVIVNYDLAPSEKESKEYAYDILNETVDSLKAVDLQMHYLKSLLDFADNTSTVAFSRLIDFQNIDNTLSAVDLNSYNNRLKIVLELWRKENYSAVIILSSNLKNDVDESGILLKHAWQNANSSIDRMNGLINRFNVVKSQFGNAINYMYNDTFMDRIYADTAFDVSNFYNNYFYDNGKNNTMDEMESALESLENNFDFYRQIINAYNKAAIDKGSDERFMNLYIACYIKGNCKTFKRYPISNDFTELLDIRETVCSDIKTYKKAYSDANTNYAYSYYVLYYNTTKFNDSKITDKNVLAFLSSKMPEMFLENISVLQTKILENEKNKVLLNISGRNIVDLQKTNTKLSIEKFSKANDCANFISYYDSIGNIANYSSNIQEITYPYSDIYLTNYLFDVLASKCQPKFENDSVNILRKDNLYAYLLDGYSNLSSYIYSGSIHNQNKINIFVNGSREVNIDFYRDYYCKKKYDNSFIYTMNVKYLAKKPLNFEVSIFNSTFNIMIPDTLTRCCAFGICTTCCISNCSGNNYPLIFIHGHSFNKDQSPEYGINLVGKLQNAINKNMGYIGAGTLLPSTTDLGIDYGSWGRIDAPISLKYSYYYGTIDINGTLKETVQNNYSISDYADRLAKAINQTLYRTGKNKVDIVAHSMGGLVAREYIRKYGSSSVNKVIMIATPNSGVTGNVRDYCDVLGGEQECSELAYNSTFLKRLNDPVTNPISVNSSIKYYTIIGRGCMTDGKDGDGTVQAENAYLANAKNYYISGNCTLTLPLHNAMLDPSINDAASKIVEEILGS